MARLRRLGFAESGTEMDPDSSKKKYIFYQASKHWILQHNEIPALDSDELLL